MPLPTCRNCQDPISWVRHHRFHHRNTDRALDPHSEKGRGGSFGWRAHLAGCSFAHWCGVDASGGTADLDWAVCLEAGLAACSELRAHSSGPVCNALATLAGSYEGFFWSHCGWLMHSKVGLREPI